MLGVLGFSIWLGLLAAAGITFPRRPAVSGFLFIALGVWSMVLRYFTANPVAPPPALVLFGVAAIWFVIGIRSLRLHHN